MTQTLVQVNAPNATRGRNLDYVLELDRALAAMGGADPEVSAVAERLRRPASG